MRLRLALVVVIARSSRWAARSRPGSVIAEDGTRSCPPAGSSLVAGSSIAAVYRAEKGDDVVYGCLRRTRREVVFPGGENEYTSVRIAGRFVAARDHLDSGAPDPCYGITVAVMNLGARPESENQLGQRYREARGNCEGFEQLDLPTSIVLSGPSIAALMLRGGTLSWRNGSQLRTARLK